VTFVFFRKVLISSLRNEEKTHLLEASVRHFVLPTVKSTFPTPPTLLEFVIFLDSLKLYIMCILLRCTGQTWPFCFHLIFCAVFPAESMKIILDCRKENGGNASIRHRIKYPYPAALSIPFFITAYITWCIYPPPLAQQPPVGQDLLIIKASRSHSDTPHSVGLLWTSDQPNADISTWQHTALTTDSHLCLGRIRTGNTRNREAADPLLRRWSSGRI